MSKFKKLEELNVDQLKKIHLDKYNNDEDELEGLGHFDYDNYAEIKESLIAGIRSYIEYSAEYLFEKYEDELVDKDGVKYLKFKIQQKLNLQGAGIGVLDFEILNEIQDVINSF